MKKFMSCVLAIAILAMVAGCAEPFAQGIIDSQAPQAGAVEEEVPLAAAAQAAHVDAASLSAPEASNEAAMDEIGEAAAKEIALKHAGLSEAEVTFIKAKLDYDDGRAEYDIEFYAGNTEYDYEVDAYTGEILSYDHDVESYAPAAAAQGGASANDSGHIGEAAAKEIALKHAGFKEADVTFIKSKLDRDDGRAEYDIEFYVGTAEYDYEIDAATGEIRSYDYDIDDYSAKPATDSDSARISLDEAKAIALKKAGLSAGDVTYTEASFEYDDGIAAYQIEFISGGKEYECEINAVTGAIMEYDVEKANR